jgi:ascorbate-specific PTS system EIIC-type component UlaA
MSEIKKGIEPKKENNTQTQRYYNKIDNACLILFVAFVILVVLGRYLGNRDVLMLGLGIGMGTTIISAISTNMKEDEEDE